MTRTRKAGWSNAPESEWGQIDIGDVYQCVLGTGEFSNGRHVYVGPGSWLNTKAAGRLTIGDNVWIGSNVLVEGWDVTIGSNVGIGPGVVILSSQHTGIPVTTPAFQTDLQIEPVIISDGVDIGANATILPGVTIGEGSIIGAGAVVTKDVPPWEVWVGNPARKLKMRGE